VEIAGSRDFFGRPQGAEAKHAAPAALAFDDSETRRAGSGGVNSQHTIGFCTHANRTAAAKVTAAGKSLASISCSGAAQTLDDFSINSARP
jgi:hypothetical protein